MEGARLHVGSATAVLHRADAQIAAARTAVRLTLAGSGVVGAAAGVGGRRDQDGPKAHQAAERERPHRT